MNTDKHAKKNNTIKNPPRLLGAAFLTVIVTSLVAGLIPTASSIPDILAKVSENPTLMRITVIGGLLNSVGIVALATLLYIVLKKQNKDIALAALGLWLIEAIFFAIMQLASLALIPLSRDFVAANSPTPSIYQTLGDFLYNGIYSNGLTIHMWFYCIGGFLWYYLFYQSRFVPRPISLLGLFAVTLGLGGIVSQLFGYAIPMVVYLPIGVFELIIGTWLLLKGIKDQQPIQTYKT